MKYKKPTKRIWAIAIVSAVVLTAGFLFVNAFWGNPVSSAIADGKINDYLAEKYPSLLLTDDKKISYDFLNRTYGKTVKSPGSADVFFRVSYMGSRVSDDYESSVQNGSNTLSRLSGEYSALALGLLKQSLGAEVSHATVVYAPKEGEDLTGVVRADMAFDKALPIDAELTVDLITDGLSPQDLAKRFEAIHAAMQAGGCRFVRYSIAAESGKALAAVNGVTPEDIESGELESRIDAAFNRQNAGSIGAFRKG